MTESLAAACDAIAATLRSVDGLKNVPINPPEQMSYDTFAVVYPYSGSIDLAPTGTRRALHSIAVDVLTRRVDLARDIARVKPLIEPVADALMREVSYDSDGNPGDMFSGTINTFGSLSYSWLQTDYAGVAVVGYHFTMNEVKILVNL